MVQPRPAPVRDEDLPEPPQVRRLRLLVTLLMVVLILGMVVVAGAMVVRLGLVGSGGEGAVAPVTAEALRLPEGADVVAIGQGRGGILVVTRDAQGAETLRVLDPETGAEKSATPIVRE